MGASPTVRIVCRLAAPGYFPQGDLRQGEYSPGQVYDLPEAVAMALLDGEGFELVAEEGEE